MVGAGQVGSRSQVPWAKVGPGWELVQYSSGTIAKHAPTTLYLVDPYGGRYALYTWRGPGWAPSLLWSAAGSLQPDRAADKGAGHRAGL
jgi:TolB protein